MLVVAARPALGAEVEGLVEGVEAGRGGDVVLPGLQLRDPRAMSRASGAPPWGGGDVCATTTQLPPSVQPRTVGPGSHPPLLCWCFCWGGVLVLHEAPPEAEGMERHELGGAGGRWRPAAGLD